MSPAKRKPANGIVIGGVPRADLLPPEIQQDEVAKRQRRNLLALFVLVAFLVIVAYGAVSVQSLAANVALTEAEQRGNDLIAEQGEYSEVRQVQGRLVAGRGQLVAASAAEVQWGTFLGAVQARLPEGSSFDSVTASLTALTGASTSPIYESGVYTIDMVVYAPTATSASAFRSGLESLPGYLNAQSKLITDVDAPYAYSLTVSLNADVLWGRYFESPEQAAEALQAAIDQGIVQ